MRALIEHFDRAYIINLPDRQDRRNLAEQEFRSVGIDAPNEKVRYFSAVRPTEAGDFYSLGARGSFNSHRKILELAAADGLNNVLVFEDDVTFRNVPSDVIENIMTALRGQSWDVVYFGYIEPSNVESDAPLTPWPSITVGGHFYAVNGPFFETMIRYMNDCEKRTRNHPLGGPMSRDGAYNHIRFVTPNIKVLLAVPNLAIQASSRTDIAQLRLYDRISWLRPAISLLRRAKTRLRIALDKAP